MSPVRLLLLTPNLDNNSLGRTYCLWLLARHLGMQVQVASVKGDRVWPPLAATDFAAHCHRVQVLDHCRTVGHGVLDPRSLDPGRLDPRLLELAGGSDVLVAVKPVENSFGLGQVLAEALGKPLLLDVDDPDIEVRTAWRPWHERVTRRALKPRYRSLLRLRRQAAGTRVLVGNPQLQRLYGGRLVPHVRPGSAWVDRPVTDTTVVRFVGSPRGHKGVDVLRQAVARLADQGYRLEVTADAPPDAAAWERWLGTTSFEEGQRLVATADVVAIPSRAGEWSPAQLPVKLVDAMMAGVPVVASDVGPIGWALDGSGVLVPPGDVDALTAGLASLADPAERQRLGRRSHARALATFSVESVAPTFAEEVTAVLDRPGAPTARTAEEGP